MDKYKNLIAIIGMGYVGLPLAVEFGKIHEVVGFDINQSRIHELQQGQDKTKELTYNQIKSSSNLTFSDNSVDIKDSEIYIITVPTPRYINLFSFQREYVQ